MYRDGTFINIALSIIFMAFGMNRKKAVIAFKMHRPIKYATEIKRKHDNSRKIVIADR